MNSSLNFRLLMTDETGLVVGIIVLSEDKKMLAVPPKP